MNIKTADGVKISLGGEYWKATPSISNPFPVKYVATRMSEKRSLDMFVSAKGPAFSPGSTTKNINPIVATSKRNNKILKKITKTLQQSVVAGPTSSHNSNSFDYYQNLVKVKLPPLDMPLKNDKINTSIYNKNIISNITFDNGNNSFELDLPFINGKIDFIFSDFDKALEFVHKELLEMSERIQDSQDMIIQELRNKK